MQGRALLSKSCCTAFIRFLYCMCTHSALHMFALHFCALHGSHFYLLFFLLRIIFLVYGCALHSSQSCAAGVHILHCVHPFLCESCDCLYQRCGQHDLHLRTASGALILRCALRESASLVLHFDHVLYFMHTYCELPDITLENCIHFYLEGSAAYNFLEIIIQ